MPSREIQIEKAKQLRLEQIKKANQLRLEQIEKAKPVTIDNISQTEISEYILSYLNKGV